MHPRSLLAGDPLGALDGVRAQQTPTPEDDLPDVSLTLGGASHTVDVAGYFSDAVHGYEVTAAPNGIVRISRSGTEVTLEPVAVGSATVTVRGRKLRGSERKRFAVTVVAMVAAPTATGSIAALTLTEGVTHAVTASDYFEGAGITYTAASSDTAAATVEVAGADVTVKAVAAGSATVTVTATNSGGSAEQRFAVTVLPPAPATVGSIGAVTLAEGETHVEDVSAHFSGEGITYTAESSNVAVATVATEAAAVTVKAVAPGDATVTVTATNAGGSAGQSFAVTVQLPAVTLTRGDARTLELADHFGEEATGYGAAVAPAGIVGLALTGSQLTLTALASGNATVTLEVTSADGTAEHSLAVTVLPPAPAAVGSIEAVILAERETHMEDAAAHFNGEGITYTAESSKAAVATVAVEGTTVTVTAVGAGDATVTLTATNAGGSVGQSFSVTVQLPSIILAEDGTRTIELADYFGADVTGYEVAVSPSGIVHASRSGSQLTLTAVAAGSATVTVTATSPGGRAEQGFAVTVVPPAPGTVGSIEAVTIIEDATHAEDVASYFEGEGVTYGAVSSDEAVATVEVDGSEVTVTAVAAGSATVTVTATSPGGRAEQGFAVTVVPPAPGTVGSIEAVTIIEDATHAEDAASYFEGEGVTYGAMSSDTEVATVEVEGSEVTVTAVAAGSATVTVTATNGGGSAEQGFLVTVVSPAPVAVGSIEAVTIIEDATHTEDVASYFEGEGVTYGAVSSDTEVATVAVEGSEVTVTAVAAGSATVTVTATNGGGSAEQGFLVTVVSPAPVAVGSIEAVTIIEDATHAEDVASYFEGEGVTYGAMSSDTEVATVEVDGSEVTVTAVAAGSATVTVTATNMSGSEQQEFVVEVRLAAPLAIGAIADIALREDGVAREIELADQFGGVVEGYDASATPAGVVHVWESGGRLTLTPLASGVAVVTVAATNAGGVAQQAFLSTVRDGAPRALGTTPLVEIVEGDHSIIGVSSYFEGEGVTFAAESSRPGVVAVEAHGETTVVSGLAVGIALVTVTATNEAGSAAQELVVVVSRRAPKVRDGIEALTLTSGGAARTIDLSIHFSGSLTRFGAIAERTGIVHLWESAGRLTFTPLAAGSSTVTVWSANTGGTASQTFDVSVRPRAPRALASSTLLTLSMDGRPLSVELANYFGGNVERYALAATPGGVVHRWESGGLLTLTPLAAGLATLEVTALNAGGSAEQQFTVVVQPAPPTALGRIVAAPLAAGGAGQEIALADYFDGEVAHYEVVSRPDGILHLWESGGRLRLTPLSAGVATVTVTVSNGSGSASQIFAVAVAPAAPQTPGRAERIALAEGGAVREIDLGDYFGGEAARYHLTADRGGVVHGWESAGRLTLTPLAAGVATVVVTATNSAGSAEQPFIVTVGAAAPEALGRLEGSTLNEAGESHEIELADYFSGAIARYRVSADPAGVVHAWVSEGRLRLTPLAAGVAMVAVTASNEGGSARQEFAVVVE